MDYKSSGVDIDAGNRAVELIKANVQRTHTPFVLSSLGGFAAPVALPPGYQSPVLVSCTDGVGTKLKIAIDLQTFDTIGIDLVAMCVNDLICCGAKPLFFLDYIACHQLVPDHAAALISGMTDGCIQSGCALVGGEMAEMNDLYRPGEFDLAGFSVGVVEQSKMIDGQSIKPGDRVYGIPSSGIHSNGFSLVRHVLTPEICDQHGIDYKTLLTPTRIYVNQIHGLLSAFDGHITGLAHITGGGLAENIHRIVPEGCQVCIDESAWQIPSVFHQIQLIGRVEPDEMRRVFNMGIGFVVISSVDLPESDQLIRIGSVESGPRGVSVA